MADITHTTHNAVKDDFAYRQMAARIVGTLPADPKQAFHILGLCRELYVDFCLVPAPSAGVPERRKAKVGA